jgi:hypothetical protein
MMMMLVMLSEAEGLGSLYDDGQKQAGMNL